MAIYHKPTAKFAPKIEVAALFIEHGNQILLLHRHPKKSQGGLWGIPAGKVERGEVPHSAVIREVQEETGYVFPDHLVHCLQTVYIEYDGDEHFVYHMFRTRFTGDPAAVKLNPDEHIGFMWATPQKGLQLPLIRDEDACFRLVYGL